MDAMEINVNAITSGGKLYPFTCVKNRTSNTIIPPLEIVAMKAVTGAGAPS